MSVQNDDFRQMVTLAIVIVMAVVVVGQVFAAATTVDGAGGGERESFEQSLAIDGGTASLTGSNISTNSVEQSLGDAAALDGSSDSYLSSAAAPNTSGNFTVATYVRVDNTTGTRIVYADDQRLILYNGSASQWVGVYYEPSTQRTWAVSQLATDATNWTHVALMLDAGALSIIEDNQFSSVTATNDANTTNQTFTGQNLAGALDETRVFDEPLTSSERQQLVDTPTAPLDTATRDARVMYDSYDQSPATLPVYFASESVDAQSITLIDGFAGEPTQAGTDYSLSGGTLTTLGGGSLDGAPVVFASWSGFVSALSTLFIVGDLVGVAFRLAGMLLVVLVASILFKTKLLK